MGNRKLTIINTVYGDASGGRWQAVLNMTNALRNKNHTVFMLTGSENNHLIKGSEIKVSNNRGFYDPIAAIKIRKIVKKIKPDIIIAHSGRAVYLFKHALLGLHIPIVAVNHSHNIKRSLAADAFIHLTPHLDYLVSRSFKGSEKNLPPSCIIPNMVCIPENYHVLTEIKTPLIIGMMTRLVESKGVQFLITAMALLKQKGIQVHLLIAGDGEYSHSLKELVHKLQVQDMVSFLGWISGEKKIQFYEKVDVIAVPSINDTQPLSSLDAFAWGKILISSDAIGPAQVAKDRINSLVFKSENSDDLAEKIQQIINSPQMALKLAEQGHEEAKTLYHPNTISNQLDIFLNSVVNMSDKYT